MAINGYNESVEGIEKAFVDFVSESKAGAEGRGSKTSALRARKLSNDIARQLKDFRKVSLDNDRAK